MTTIVWPATLRTGAVSFGVDFDVQIIVKRSGGIQTYGLPGGRWVASIGFEADLETAQRPMIEALVMSLEGGANRLQMPHLGRPVPNGTLRGAPVTAAGVSAGAKSVSLTNCNGTLKAGDIIGLGNQFCMVLADISPSGGTMTASVTPAIRTALTAGQSVVWNRPTTLWVPKTASAGPFPYASAKSRPRFSIDFVEAYT